MHIITTDKKWEEVMPRSATANLLKLLNTCRQHQDVDKILAVQQSCRFMFNGASRQNKGTAAALAGSHLGIEVYRIDVSAVVSKYIGETEKNIDKIFTAAAGKSWILFFDEADALFGKRTDVKSGHEHYANQEISYLLQRLERYRPPVFIAVNNKDTIAPAVVRYFHQTIHFSDTGKP
ncbi:MAG: ATP-binding protein [Chitinophagaceae bacterium]